MIYLICSWIHLSVNRKDILSSNLTLNAQFFPFRGTKVMNKQQQSLIQIIYTTDAAAIIILYDFNGLISLGFIDDFPSS